MDSNITISQLSQLSLNGLITKNVFEVCSHIKTLSCPLRALKQQYLIRKPCFVGGHIRSASCLENPVGMGDRGIPIGKSSMYRR